MASVSKHLPTSSVVQVENQRKRMGEVRRTADSFVESQRAQTHFAKPIIPPIAHKADIVKAGCSDMVPILCI